jgi:hypothetical protein
MQMPRILNLGLVFLSLTCCVFAQQEKSNDTENIHKFWTEFRTAILNKDNGKVASLTNFPFEVRGPDDSDPVVYHNEKGFFRILDDILDQPVYQINGTNINVTSMRDIIKNKPDVFDSDLLSDDLVRVELFTFKKVQKKWLFNKAYFEE